MNPLFGPIQHYFPGSGIIVGSEQNHSIPEGISFSELNHPFFNRIKSGSINSRFCISNMKFLTTRNLSLWFPPHFHRIIFFSYGNIIKR